MRRGACLPKLQWRILEMLGKVQYATTRQLAALCGAQTSNTHDAITSLLDTGLADCSLIMRPMILYLTPAAGRMLDEPMAYSRRHASWAVMAQACHRNAAAAALAAQHPGFYFLFSWPCSSKASIPGTANMPH